MIYTYTTNVGDGVTKDFPFSFAGQDTGYLSTSNIVVTVAGVESSDYSIYPSSPNVVRFNNPPAIGAEVLIRRVMPKLVPYTDFSRGNPFSQDALNNTNLQMLYLLQEIYDGYLPSGFYFRVDIDMRGKKLINLGDGVNDGDSVNMGQFKKEVERNDVQDGRITALEDNVVAGEQANFFAQLYTASGGETTITTTNNLFCAALYIQGLYQHKIAGAYSQVGGVITLSEPLEAGTEVYLILGTELPSDSLYATIESVAALNSVVQGINSNYAKKGANNDITSLTGLTTPLSVQQGGLGNTAGRAATATKLDVPRGLRVSLSNTNAVNFDGSSDVSNIGVGGILPVALGGSGASTAAGARTSLGAAASGDNIDITSLAGNTAGSEAAAGKVGEFKIAEVGTDVALTTSVAVNVVSLQLTAGDWEISGYARLVPAAGTTISSLLFGPSTSAGNPLPVNRNYYPISWPAGTGPLIQLGPSRFLLTATTTIYLVINAVFGGSTCAAQGAIKARRMR